MQSIMRGDGNSSEYVRIISRMIFYEPPVLSAIQILQAHCLRHGIQMRWGNTAPTPQFQRHMNDFFEPFCKDAIMAFLAVGFAPFRLRRAGTAVVPEVLPLGTYTWNVVPNPQPQDHGGARKRAREDEALIAAIHKKGSASFSVSGATARNGLYQDADSSLRAGIITDYYPTAGAQKHEDELLFNDGMSNRPLLKYEVTTSNCKDPIIVYNYVPPQGNLTCFSALASLVGQYTELLRQRERAQKAEEWNSRPNMVFEEQDKTMINDIANTGACIQSMHTQIYAGMEQNTRMARQETMQELVDITRDRVGMPDDATILVAPKNNTAHSMDKAEPPIEMQKRELFFARNVALALGVPASFAMQGTAGLSAASGGGGSWNDGPEVSSITMMDTCKRLSKALQGLMQTAYFAIYGAEYQAHPGSDAVTRRMPEFRFPCAPAIPYEHLLPIFDAKLLDDESYSYMIQNTLGFSLDRENAMKAREERHRAINIMPFKDRKDTGPK